MAAPLKSCVKCRTGFCSEHDSEDYQNKSQVHKSLIRQHFPTKAKDKMIVHIEPNAVIAVPFIQNEDIHPIPPSRMMGPNTTTTTKSYDKFSNPPSQGQTEFYKSRGTQSTALVRLKGEKYKPHTKYHFLNIKDVSFVSSSSPDKTYSEISMFVWLTKQSTPSYTEKSKLCISGIYDSVENLWSLSARLTKKHASLSEDEQNTIHNRLLFSRELKKEVKKMLLYFGANPREVYLALRRKMATEELKLKVGPFGFDSAECSSHKSCVEAYEAYSGYTQQYNFHGYEG